MARKTVIDLNADSTVSLEKPGQTVEGYYIGAKEVKTKFGPSQLHHFQTETGVIGVWGSKQLDDKLKTLSKGVMTYVTYQKKIQVPNGSMKVFTVEFDDELSTDVSSIQVNYENSQEPEESGTFSEEDNSQQAELEAAEELARAEAALEASKAKAVASRSTSAPSASRTAAATTVTTPTSTARQKVQALIDRNKAKTA